jgi:hypothetical protein
MLVNQPEGYPEMAMFSAATHWRCAIAFLPGVLMQFSLPFLSNLNGERDVSRYGKVLRWNLVLTAAAAGAVALPIVLAAPQIMRLYGSTFQQGSLVLVLSVAAAVLASVNGVVATAILSGGSAWVGLAFNAMWALVLLTCSSVIVPGKLAAGLAGSLLVAYVAHTAWQAVYVISHLSRSEPKPGVVSRY